MESDGTSVHGRSVRGLPESESEKIRIGVMEQRNLSLPTIIDLGYVKTDQFTKYTKIYHSFIPTQYQPIINFINSMVAS